MIIKFFSNSFFISLSVSTTSGVNHNEINAKMKKPLKMKRIFFCVSIDCHLRFLYSNNKKKITNKANAIDWIDAVCAIGKKRI